MKNEGVREFFCRKFREGLGRGRQRERKKERTGFMEGEDIVMQLTVR